ncbi:MAG: tyrosine--tRNA ligase [Thermoflexales bacterium]|nr:tyrosine--tRNA ligase [Thermoflexales bacterium]
MTTLAMPIDEQVALLMQGTEYGDEQLKQAMAGELRQRLAEAEKEGRPLRVYAGFDPRTADLHLGHTIPIRKMRQFQELGHEVTFLIGTGTSMVGDPSDKDKLRAVLTEEETKHNGQTYAEQAFRILDRAKTRVLYNHEWLLGLTLADMIKIASNFTVQQFIQRENFKLRWDKGEPVYLHETFYALMQAYDAVNMNTDVQIGGSDQLFNIITAGRKLQEACGQKPQIGIIMGILPGTDGEVRMSKSLGNHIPIMAPPEDMYGKVMSLPDKAMPLFFKLVTRYTPGQIAAIEQGLAGGSVHPRDAKMELAREIVSIFYGDDAVGGAEEHFKRVFQERDMPEDMPEFELEQPDTILNVLAAAGLISSRGEGRRLIDQRGVKLDGQALESIEFVVEPGQPRVLQVGKRKFLRLV